MPASADCCLQRRKWAQPLSSRPNRTPQVFLSKTLKICPQLRDGVKNAKLATLESSSRRSQGVESASPPGRPRTVKGNISLSQRLKEGSLTHLGMGRHGPTSSRRSQGGEVRHPLGGRARGRETHLYLVCLEEESLTRLVCAPSSSGRCQGVGGASPPGWERTGEERKGTSRSRRPVSLTWD